MRYIISVMNREILQQLKVNLVEKEILHQGILTPKEIVLKEMLPLCNSSLVINESNEEMKKILNTYLKKEEIVINEYKTGTNTAATAVFVREVYDVVNKLKEAYLDSSNNRPFVFASSYGKDSVMQLYCMWLALIEIREEYGVTALKRKIFIVCSDTGLETPEVRDYMYYCSQIVQEFAIKENLPIHTKVVQPPIELSFAVKVIGKGVTISTGRSTRRNCTYWFKISPMDTLFKELTETYGELVIFIAVRNDESENRKRTIEKYEKESFIFDHDKPNQFMCHPIKNLTTKELWDTLKHHQDSILPFGIPFEKLYALYENSNECPMQVSSQNKNSCGTNRNGCVICMMIEEDKMLLFQRDIQKRTWASPLLEFRTKLRQMLFDCNLRRHPSKHKNKQVNRYNPFIETKEEVVSGEQGKNGLKPKQYKLHREQKQYDFYTKNKGIVKNSQPVYPNVMTGSLTLKARIFLLKNALWYQRLAGVEFVNKEQLLMIKQAWKEEFDWIDNEEDLKAEPVELYNEDWGVLEIDAKFKIKINETTIPNLHLPEEYNYKRNEYKLGKMKGERRILNEDPSKKNNYLFYIHRQMGGNESEILSIIEKAEKRTRITLPIFFDNGWTTENEKRVYWNIVTFIVCKPNIQNYADAAEFVENYISEGLKNEESINWWI